MKKRIIGIASIIAVFAIVAIGAFSMSGENLTAVTEEYISSEFRAGSSTPVNVKIKNVIYEQGKTALDMKNIDNGASYSVTDSTSIPVSKNRYDGNYKIRGYEVYAPRYDGASHFPQVKVGSFDPNGTEERTINIKNCLTSGKFGTTVSVSSGQANIEANTDEDITIYAIYDKQFFDVTYKPVLVNTSGTYVGGGTVSGGGTVNSIKSVNLELAVPNEEYYLDKYEILVDGLRMGEIPSSTRASGFTVSYGSSFSLSTEVTGGRRKIVSNGNTVIYAVFKEKPVDQGGIWLEIEALPEATETRIRNSSGIVSQSKGTKTSYFVEYGDTSTYSFGCSWNYYSANTNRYVSIDGGNLVSYGSVNKSGVRAQYSEISFDWSKFNDSNPMPKKITYVFYAYEYNKEKDDKSKDSEYPYQAIVTSIPENGGTASANPSMNRVPYTANLVATPAKGYVLDHWTINGEDKGLDKENIQVQISGLDMIAAYFKPGEYEVRVASCEPLGGGSATKGIGFYNYGDIPKITISANDNYELESWSYISTDGVQHSGKFNEGEKEQIITLPEIKEDIDLHLNFRSLKFRVQSYPAPDSGDSKSYISTTSTVGNENEVEALRGGTVYLKAKPASGYTFQYWTNNKGDIIKGIKASDGSYTASTTVMAADSFVAHFAGSKLEFRLETNMNDKSIGTVKVETEGRQEGIGDMISVERGDDTPKSVTFKAYVKNDNYVFSKWIIIAPDGSQTESGSADITVTYNNTTPGLDGRYTYRAVFEKKKVEISAVASILGKGNFTLESNGVKSTSGKITAEVGSNVKITYTPTDASNKYWVSEWKDGSGTTVSDGWSIDYSSVPYKFILNITANVNEKYTATIVNMNPVLYVSAEPSDYGKVSVNDGYSSSFVTYETDPVTALRLTATPGTNYRFVEWRKDGVSVGTSTTLSIGTISDDTTYEAIFGPETLKMSAKTNSTSGKSYGEFTVNEYNPAVSAPVNTYTGTSIDSKSIGAGNKVTFSVRPTSDRYKFDHWEKGSNSDYITSESEFTIEKYNEATDMVFTAVFKDTVPSDVKISAGDSAYKQYISVYDTDGLNNWVKIDDSDYATIKAYRGETLELKAKIDQNAPYVFDRWKLDAPGGNTIELTSNPANISTDKISFNGDVNYTSYVVLYLKEVKYTVNAKASPINGGVVKINDKADGSSKVQVSKNDLVKLYAIPEPGYVFDYWSDGTQRLDGTQDANNANINVLTLPAVTNDENITAYFVKEKVKIEYEASPSEVKTLSPNSVSIDYYGVKPDAENFVPLNTRVTLKAETSADVRSEKYKFVRWEWIDWKSGQKMTSTDEMLDFTDISNDVKFIAVYRKSTHSVEFADPGPSGRINEIKIEQKAGVSIDSSNPKRCKVNDGVRVKVKVTTNSGIVVEYIKDQKDRIYNNFERSGDTIYFTTPEVHEDLTFRIFADSNTGKLMIKSSPADAGMIKYGGNDYVYSGEYTITKGTNVTVEAKVTDPSYRFKYFEYVYPERKRKDSDKVTIVEKPAHYSTSNNPFTLYDAGDMWVEETDKQIEIIAVFEKINSKVNVVSDPQTGGRAYMFVDSEAQTASGDGFTEMHVDVNEPFTLIAVPNEGYKFDHFTDSNGTIYDLALTGEDYTEGYLKIPSVSEDTTYTAHFVKDLLNVNVYTNPTGGGTFIFKNDKETEKEAEIGGFAVDYDSNFTITAYPKAGYKFERWDIEDKEGNKSSLTYNPLNVSEIKKDTNYTAVFTPAKGKVKTVASPLDGGTVTLDGGVTERDYEGGETITITATPADGYVFDCLKDSKGVKYEGTADSSTGVYTFSIPGVTSDETFTGYFIKRELNVTIKCVPSAEGFLEINGKSVDSGHTETVSGTGSVTVSVKVKDADTYKFVRWEDEDGNSYVNNPLTLTNIKKSMTLTAILDKEVSKTGIKVVASPAIGGHTDKKYNDKDSATITAIPNTGYKFICWKKGDEVIARTLRTTVTDLTDGTVYTAYFEKNGNYNAKSGITDEHYYDEKRKNTTPNYSVTENTIKSKASAQVQLDKNNLSNALPANKTYAAYGKVTEYFEQHRKNNKYVFDDGELFTTKNEHMPIEMIPTETDVLARAEEFSYNKYGKLYDTEIIAAVDVSIPSDFAEGPRTYIWRNVKANFKDNIYVLYLTKNNDDYKWATGVYDMYDDVEEQFEALRFTIPGNGKIVRIVAVRVTIPED